jgi:mycothiol synthase
VHFEVIRASGPERLEELGELFRAARERTHHEPLGEHKFLDLVHGGPDCFRGIVATDDAHDVVGYAHLSRHGDSRWGLELVADDGVRAELARRAIDILASEGGGHLHLWIFKPSEADDALARELGLRPGRDLLHMRVALPLGKTLEPPEGIVLRHFFPGVDEQEWLDVNNRAFAEHPEQGAWDMKTLKRRMDEAWFDAEGFLIAEDHKGIAGFCWTKINPDCGEIYVIGVDPRAQSSGLGKVLVVAGLEHISEHRDHGCLYVDSAQKQAVELYTKLGFTEDHCDRAYIGEIAGRAA